MLPMPLIIRGFVLGAVALGAMRMTACQTTLTPEPSPAIITQTTPATLGKISSAVSQALGNRDIALTPAQIEGRTSFTVAPLDLAKRGGLLIDGRSSVRPDHFDIMKAGSRAYLIHRETGVEIDLKGVALETAELP